MEREHLHTFFLDIKNHVLDMPSLCGLLEHFSPLRGVKANCAAIIVVHNHPSGDPTPSPEDVRVTEQIVQAGKMLDIAVLDHVIIGQQRYVSLKERGLGFGP